MSLEPKNQELSPLNAIRVETVLSRYPIHRLAKWGDVRIAISERDERGATVTEWEVSFNSKHGQPGQLAYKLDTLVVNRRIDEERRPLPKVIRLGSLREIAGETGTGEKNTGAVKKALYQNAAAFINAKVTYTTKEGGERSFEFGATRYDVVFTGKKLPDGSRADAVYVVLHDIYRELLDSAPRRPLDYDYLKELPPAPQRFYELISFQIYAALKHNRPRAKMLYSEFCTYAPLARYGDYEHVKKQMYKVHAPHRKSGYIAAVEFRETTDGEGNPDWEMLYTPGARARAEFRAFTQPKKAGGAAAPRQLPEPPTPAEPTEPETASESKTDPLVEQLRKFGVSEAKAKSLVLSHRAAAEAQIAAYPYRGSRTLKNAAGWLVAAIEGNYTLPALYLEEQERKQHTLKAKERQSGVDRCELCDSHGFRRVRSEQYPHGAMKRCTHDHKVEAKYPDA